MESQTIICPACQTPNPARNLYCQSCGKPIMQAAPVSEIPVQPSQNPPPAPLYSQVPASQPAPVQSQAYPPQNLPAQQPYYPPPPPPPPVAPAAPNLAQLGVRKEGWHAIASGEADKSERVQALFVEDLKNRGIPMVTVEKVEFSAGFSKKAYHLVRHPAGSMVAAAEPVGRDLSLSWAMYVPQVPNWKMLGILAGIAFAVSFLTSLNLVSSFGYFFVGWVFGTFRWLLDVAVLALIAGYIWKGSFWYFFMDSPNEIAKETLTALKLAVSQSLVGAAEKAGIDISRLEEE